jgi:hypothetical protein
VQRQQQIDDWLRRLMPGRPFVLAPASADIHGLSITDIEFSDG